MKKEFYEDDHQKRRETYLLAARNPWLLWRLQVFRAGYVPPLIPGQIPPDMMGITLGTQPAEYDADELVKHANQIRAKEKHYLAKAFTILLVSLMVIIGFSVYFQFKWGKAFHIPILEQLVPQVESTQTNVH